MIKSSASLTASSWLFRSTPRPRNPSDFSRLAKCPPMKPPAPHTNALRITAGIAETTYFPLQPTRSRTDHGFSSTPQFGWLRVGRCVVTKYTRQRPVATFECPVFECPACVGTDSISHSMTSSVQAKRSRQAGSRRERAPLRQRQSSTRVEDVQGAAQDRRRRNPPPSTRSSAPTARRLNRRRGLLPPRSFDAPLSHRLLKNRYGSLGRRHIRPISLNATRAALARFCMK